MNENQVIQPTPQRTDNITFDYNQLYAEQQVNQAPVAPEINTPEITPGIQETPIVFADTDKPKEETVVKKVIPSFDANALEGNEALSHEELINSMRSDTQQEDAEFKKNLLFIAAFFGVIIFAIVVLFPMLVKM